MAAIQKTIRHVVSTTKTAQPLAPYSKGIRVDKTLYVSGQIGLDPKTGEFSGEDVESQAKQCMVNLGSVLEAGGSSFDKVVKTTVMMADIADYGKINDIYATYFPNIKPARSAYAVAALPKNAKVEIEAIAIVGDMADE
ncbi:hypothetical protein LOD99_13986 [Oopsacas minuta]|uniref:Uncharacterized protein n=1 Tax=Oopsacas minuta TaxID=111878 RepID=A0AAV7KI62_9METZ|nr:hypothetical protein LOD99_13986 [Oopsacas minuta]